MSTFMDLRGFKFKAKAFPYKATGKVTLQKCDEEALRDSHERQAFGQFYLSPESMEAMQFQANALRNYQSLQNIGRFGIFSCS